MSPITLPTGYNSTKPWEVYATYPNYNSDISNNYDRITTAHATYDDSWKDRYGDSPTIPTNDTIDNSGNLLYIHDNNNPSPNIKDVLLQDNNDILVQQNMTYILGMITAASLIIVAIMISRR